MRTKLKPTKARCAVTAFTLIELALGSSTVILRLSPLVQSSTISNVHHLSLHLPHLSGRLFRIEFLSIEPSSPLQHFSVLLVLRIR